MPIIVNKQLELDKTIQYRLSIQADLNGFSFSIVNDHKGICHFLYQSDFGYMEDKVAYETAIYKMTNSFPILSKSYAATDIIVNTNKFTAVPLSCFKSEEAGYLISMQHNLDDLEEVDVVIDNNLDLALIFAADSTILNFIKEIQPGFKIAASVYPLIKRGAQLPEKEVILIQYHKGHIHIVIYKHRKLQLCNSYPANQFSTALYFIMASIRHCNVKQETSTIYLSGNVEDRHISLLTKYFQDIKYFRNPAISLSNPHTELRYSSMMFPL